MLEFVEIIQMAVAPAFLLTGLGAILTVMANRLSRICLLYTSDAADEP